MCLILLAWQCHPRLPLLVAANRDEFHARPAERLRAEPGTGLVCGRDLQAGGTWLGLSRSGRFAVVTNFRDNRPPAEPRSRGALIDHFLRTDEPPEALLSQLAAEGQQYRGFSLLAGTADALWSFSNRTETPPVRVPPGLHGLSNVALNEPWPKVTRGTAALATLVDAAAADDARWRERAFDLLKDETQPEQVPDSDLPAEVARRNARIFIRNDTYGTRACTLVAFRAGYEMEIFERSFGPGGVPGGTHGYRLPKSG